MFAWNEKEEEREREREQKRNLVVRIERQGAAP